MCGIIGYITKENNAKDEIIKNLKKLEYRGYDSGGICLFDDNNFVIQKNVGQISDLENKLQKNINSNCGIAHTRWATHGKVTLDNTHPHTSQNQNWCVVHNGIIENYLELKKTLPNVQFYSQTDTEVIPNLLEQNNINDSLLNIKDVISKLKGSFALCIMNKKDNNTIYLARKNSPLFVAKNNDSVMASSDPICFTEKYSDYYTLPQNCIAKLTQNEIVFYNFNLKKITIKKNIISNFEKSCGLKNYKYYAEKEISEIPEVIQNITNSYKTTNYFSKIDKKLLQNINSIKLIGCGTAYHACMMGAKYLQAYCNIPSEAYIASEFRYSKQIINRSTLCIFISQSGETADTILCQNLCKKRHAKSIAIVNVPYSTLAQNCDYVLPTCAGPEVAVISTKAYNAMLYILYLLSIHMHSVISEKNCYKNINFSKIDFFKNADKIDNLVDIVLSHKKIFFIGKDEDYVTALEASLKLKEVTYINCIAIPSGELKHGTLSLIDDTSVVFIIATKKNLLSKNLASASEIKSRGGKIVFVTNLPIPESSFCNIDFIYNFSNCAQNISSLFSIVPFQLLAYKTCLKLNLNPDKPRNLAKSVTVE